MCQHLCGTGQTSSLRALRSYPSSAGSPIHTLTATHITQLQSTDRSCRELDE